ncbi:unnamed protein product [Ectocarpus sp. 12 AP-2014]
MESYRTREGADASTGDRTGGNGGGGAAGGGSSDSNPARRTFLPPAPRTMTGMVASTTAVQGERTFQTEAGDWAGAGEGSGIGFSASSATAEGPGGTALGGGQYPLSPMPRILPNAFRASPQETAAATAAAASAGEGGGGSGGVPEAFALARERAKELRPLGSARAAAELGGLLRQASSILGDWHTCAMPIRPPPRWRVEERAEWDAWVSSEVSAWRRVCRACMYAAVRCKERSVCPRVCFVVELRNCRHVLAGGNGV